MSFLYICFILLSVGSYVPAAQEASVFADRIAFIRKGEIYVADKDGSNISQITFTSGAVNEFLFSPNLKHLAYSKIIGYEGEPGLWDEGEEVPVREVCSIVIYDLDQRKIIKEIMPPEGNWIYINKWLSPEKLFYHAASGFDVWGYFAYDIKKNVEEEIESPKGYQLLDADFHRDGSVMLYVNDTGLGEGYRQHLHFVNLKSGEEKILFSKRGILSPEISTGKGYVAFLEVDWDHKTNSGTDIFWIYNIEDSSFRKIYQAPARAKGGFEISWSFDDSFIGLFFFGDAIIFEFQNSVNPLKLLETDINWCGSDKILFFRSDKIFLYDVKSGMEKVLIDNAASPEMLRR